MAFLSRLNKAHPDPENFPPARNVFDILPDSVEMPEFITDAELRKGPRNQNTLAWMNAVQTHLDEHTSWDRRMNGTLAARFHADVKACQVARISPRSLNLPLALFQENYIRDQLQPAIKELIAYEKMRTANLIKERAELASANNSSHQTNSKKRKQEDDEIQQAAKKRKEETDKGLEILVDELQSLRKLVNEKMETVDIEIRKSLHKLEGRILDLMTAGI